VIQSDFEKAYSAFENEIQSEALKEVARHWRDICNDGHLPTWHDVQPSAIKPHLPIIWAYDYDPSNDDFLGRLAGQEIVGLEDKPFKATRLSELRPNDRYPRSLIRARRVIQEPALYRGHGLVYKTAKRFGVGERIVMPLRQNVNYPGGIFGATKYRNIHEWRNSNVLTEEEQWFSLSGLAAAPLSG
jgi:hypothetical protein